MRLDLKQLLIVYRRHEMPLVELVDRPVKHQSEYRSEKGARERRERKHFYEVERIIDEKLIRVKEQFSDDKQQKHQYGRQQHVIGGNAPL